MKSIVIFGTGHQAIMDYYILREEYKIEYILDNNDKKDVFMKKRVYIPDASNVHNYFIVVCVNEMNYIEIGKQLKAYELKEFIDFCPSYALGKKIVIVHGNCHMSILKKYMKSSEEFMKRYYIYPLLPIQAIKDDVDDSIWGVCDVFIHQDIRRENAYGERLSDEYIIPKLKKGCINIAVPNLFNNFGKAFFPQHILNDKNVQNQVGLKGLFPFGDENVINLVEQGIKDINEILLFLKGNVYSEEYIKKKFDFYKESALKRQENWDIKIMEYILNNYKSKKLFYDTEHPCNDVIKEICVGVFKMLEIDEESIKEIEDNLGAYEEPVYPCVMQALELEWNNNNLRENKLKLKKVMDFDEYYKEYLYWCYEI